MPTLNGAWRTLRRFFAGADTPVTADSETGRSNTARWRNDGADSLHSGRLHGFYERVREQVYETQRNSELSRQDEVRKDRRAKRRSLSLLMRLLNPEQRQEFRTFRHFHVIGGSSGNCYRIRVAAFANIDVLCANGRVKHRLCAHPTGGVPVYDVMAAQLLHLQDPVAEQRFLQRANVHPALAEDWVRSRPSWIA
jgi:hypothetical protein